MGAPDNPAPSGDVFARSWKTTRNTPDVAGQPPRPALAARGTDEGPSTLLLVRPFRENGRRARGPEGPRPTQELID
jgi:hypothetical protein